jgi:hypothetical protein
VAQRQVGQMRLEKPLGTETWREPNRERTWVQSSVRPLMFVDNRFAAIKFTALRPYMVEQRSGFGPGRQEILPSSRSEDVDAEVAEADYALGQLIYLNDADYMRLKNAGAVVDADAVLSREDEAGEQVLDVTSASSEELAAWIREDKPNANDVVQASGGEPELAQKLLDAEVQATDGEPRKSVLDGLSKVISRG